jgi:hypothetical protein
LKERGFSDTSIAVLGVFFICSEFNKFLFFIQLCDDDEEHDELEGSEDINNDVNNVNSSRTENMQKSSVDDSDKTSYKSIKSIRRNDLEEESMQNKTSTVNFGQNNIYNFSKKRNF